MVDSVKRKLRDGVLEGEQAPAILVLDTVQTIGGSVLLKHLFRSTYDNVVGKRAQAKGVVGVCFDHSPELYDGLSFSDDLNGSGSLNCFQLLDCYTDPLGWNVGSPQRSPEAGSGNKSYIRVVRNVRDLDALLSLIIQSGRDNVNSLTKERFCVFLDSVSVLLRYHSLHAVIEFLEEIRCHDQVAALCWLVHADLHEPRAVLAFEYLSSTSIVLEAAVDTHSDFQIESEGRVEGFVRSRQKRRNGRVREQVEKMICMPTGLVFERCDGVGGSDLMEGGRRDVPKVQFNLSLTESELHDRSKVVLPFEHQGSGEERKIYDGRSNIQASYLASKSQVEDFGYSEDLVRESGEIHYFRDSDDEVPDSDEDPDDDLDI